MNWFKRRTKTPMAGQAGEGHEMTLIEQIDDAAERRKQQNRVEWDQLDEILKRAATPEARDGARMLELGLKLRIPIDELKATAEFARLAGQHRATAAELETKLATMKADCAEGEALVKESQKLIRIADAERQRVIATGMDDEMKALRLVAEAAVALADNSLIHRGQFLLSRGHWIVDARNGGYLRKGSALGVRFSAVQACELELADAVAANRSYFQTLWPVVARIQALFAPLLDRPTEKQKQQADPPTKEVAAAVTPPIAPVYVGAVPLSRSAIVSS